MTREMNFGELTLEVNWRSEDGVVVVVGKFFHISPGDTVSLPYPTAIIEDTRKEE